MGNVYIDVSLSSFLFAKKISHEEFEILVVQNLVRQPKECSQTEITQAIKGAQRTAFIIFCTLDYPDVFDKAL